MLTTQLALTNSEAKHNSRDRQQALAHAKLEFEEKENHFKLLRDRADKLKEKIKKESDEFLDRLQSAESSMQFSKADLSKDVYETVFTKGVFKRSHEKNKKNTKKKKTIIVRTVLFEGEGEEKPIRNYLYESQPENILDVFKQNIITTRDRLIGKMDEKLKTITLEIGTSAILQHSYKNQFLPQKICMAEERVDVLKSEVVNAMRRAAEKYHDELKKRGKWTTRNAFLSMSSRFSNVSWVGEGSSFDVHNARADRWTWDLIPQEQHKSIPKDKARLDEIIKKNSLTECCRQLNQSMSVCVGKKGITSVSEKLLQAELKKLCEMYPTELGIDKTRGDGLFIKLLQSEERLNFSAQKKEITEKSLKKEGSLKEDGGEVLFEVQNEYESAFALIDKDLKKIEKRAKALDDELTRISSEKVGNAVTADEGLLKLHKHYKSLQKKSQKIEKIYQEGLTSLQSTGLTDAKEKIGIELKEMDETLTHDVKPLFSNTEKRVKALPNEASDSKFETHPELLNSLESKATPIKIKSLKEQHELVKGKFKELKSTLSSLSLLPQKLTSFEDIMRKKNVIKEKMTDARKVALQLDAAKNSFEGIDQSFGKASDEKPQNLIAKANEQLQLATTAKDNLVRLQGEVRQLGSFDYPDFPQESKAMQDEVVSLNTLVTDAEKTVKSLQEKNAQFPEFVKIIDARNTADKAISDAVKAQESHQAISDDLKQGIVLLRKKVKEEKGEEEILIHEKNITSYQKAAETAGRQYGISYEVASNAVSKIKSFMDVASGFFKNNFQAEFKRVQSAIESLKNVNGESTLPTDNVLAELPSLKAYHDFLLAVNAASECARIYDANKNMIASDLKEMNEYVAAGNLAGIDRLKNKILLVEQEMNTQALELKKHMEVADALFVKHPFATSTDSDYQQTVVRYNKLNLSQFPEVNYSQRIEVFAQNARDNHLKISNAIEYLELMHQVYLLNMSYFQEQVAFRRAFGGVSHTVLEGQKEKTYKLAAGNKQQLDITTEFSVKKAQRQHIDPVASVQAFKQAAMSRLAIATNNKWYEKNNLKYEVRCTNVRTPFTKNWYTITGSVNPDNIDLEKTYSDLEGLGLNLPAKVDNRHRVFLQRN